MASETKTISAQNIFTDALTVRGGQFDISISDVSDSTVTVQRRRSGESTWLDVEAFTSDAERTGAVSGAWDVRAGIKTGDYGSDTVEVAVTV